MNKLSKILLAIIILLVIALGVSIYYCFDYRDKMLESSSFLFELTKAVESKNLKAERQEDGSIILVERTTEIEESYE